MRDRAGNLPGLPLRLTSLREERYQGTCLMQGPWFTSRGTARFLNNSYTCTSSPSPIAGSCPQSPPTQVTWTGAGVHSKERTLGEEKGCGQDRGRSPQLLRGRRMFSGHQPSEQRQAGESVEAAAMWAPVATVRRRGLSKEPLCPAGSVRSSSLEAETQEDARPETEELGEGNGQGCHSSVLQMWCYY